MSSNSLNEQIRKKVAAYFQNTVKSKSIMDFGGGTGADLEWLTKSGYRVCFCEPSKEMRKIAIGRNANQIKSENIKFVDNDEANFQNWGAEAFPEKFDAILANFCVFNTIEDMPLLLSKLDHILKPSGHIIALLLDTSIGGILKNYLKNFMVSVIRNRKPYLVVQYSGVTHTVHLHTPAQIKQAMPKGFSCVKMMPMGKPDFMMIHLQKSGYA